jgi:hypothetical protein
MSSEKHWSTETQHFLEWLRQVWVSSAGGSLRREHDPDGPGHLQQPPKRGRRQRPHAGRSGERRTRHPQRELFISMTGSVTNSLPR